jgi:D-amino-acid dehydrogenase
MDPRKSDVLILGGGVIGLCCAYFLARAGRSVRILERDTIGCGASHGNAGLITPSHAEPVPGPGVPQKALKMMFDAAAPLSIKPRLDPEFVSWGVRFMRHCNEEAAARSMASKVDILKASRVLIGKMIEAEGMKCQWAQKGMISVCLTEEALTHLKGFTDRAREHGVPSEFLDRTALHEREPALKDEVIGGVLFSQDAVVRPELFNAELARILREKGVALEENAEVKAMNVEEGGVHSAFTNRGLFEADHFVLATGAWSPELAHKLELDIPIEPGKGYSLSSNLRPEPCPRHALILEERSIAVTPWGNGFRLGGTMEFTGFNDQLTKARLTAILVGAEEYLKDVMPPGPPKEWCGLRPMTPDDLPFIGPAGKLNNLFMAAGHNMLGMSMSASTGRLITEMILGKKPHIDPSPFDPNRYSNNPDHWYNRFRRWLWAR